MNDQGDLVLRTDDRDILLQRPRLYQEMDGEKQEIDGGYVLKGHEVRFRIAAYDHRRPLVIDPVLAYATYLGGGTQDGGNAIAVDAAGNAYVTGVTDSSDFPISSGAYQSTFTGGAFTSSVTFVTKLDPTKSGNASRIYSTYLGGSGGDGGFGIAVDLAGNAYVAGLTNSSNFPLSVSPAPLPFESANMGGGDGFLTKLNATGSDLLYSTYFGGTAADYPFAIAVDGAGAAYVTGYTYSGNFPVSASAYQSTTATVFNTGFVAKFDPAQSGSASRIYATYLGGSDPSAGFGIAVDAGGHAYVTGYTAASDFPVKPNPGAFQTAGPSSGYYPDAFVTKLNTAGTDLEYSTYLGGSYDDIGRGIAVDGAGDAYVIGETVSITFGSTPFPPNPLTFQPFPVTPNAFQSPANVTAGPYHTFVTKLNANGTAELYSTLLGGNGTSYAAGIAVDAAGHAYVTGFTSATNFPLSLDAFQSQLNGNGVPTTISDVFVAKLDPTQSGGASLVYSSYLGGSGEESPYYSNRGGIAVDADGNAYVTGSTYSTDFPATAATILTTAAFQSTNRGYNDGYVAKIAPCATVPGTWAATGGMAAGRTAHTATRLANGKVLIAGGLDTGTSLDNPLASALLYDPTTGTFTPTGSMATPRFRHSATLLPNGKVLIGGGVTTGSGGICINSAELFDPAANNGTGAFTSAGSMVAFRADFTATLLPNGKVLMTGGSCTGGTSAELWDPAANNGNGGFISTGSMSTIRVSHTATLLPNGNVLVTGGTDTIAGIRLASAEIFDPAGNHGAGAFSATGSMATARGAHQATALPGGEVLVTGGLDSNLRALASAEVFNPLTGLFTITGAMTTPRSAHTATRLANGQVLITGGLSAAAAFLDSAELYDQTAGGGTGAFTATIAMATTRKSHSATLLSNGRVLVVGGQDSGPTVLASAELYSPTVCAPFNTPVGSAVNVQPVDTMSGQTPVTVTFSNVSGAGQTLVTTSPAGPTAPPNFSIGTGLYYHVETTATYSGNVTICIDYGGTPLAGTATQPVFGHFNSATGLWETVTVTSWNQAANVVCGIVTSLSPFALLVSTDSTPPTVQCSVEPNILWPPKHQLVTTTVKVAVADKQSGSAGFALTAVSSNEADKGLGPDDLPNDIQEFDIGTPDTGGRLRAERSVKGDGRVYSLTYTGSDRAGNSATCRVTVAVPLDQRR